LEDTQWKIKYQKYAGILKVGNFHQVHKAKVQHQSHSRQNMDMVTRNDYLIEAALLMGIIMLFCSR